MYAYTYTDMDICGSVSLECCSKVHHAHKLCKSIQGIRRPSAVHPLSVRCPSAVRPPSVRPLSDVRPIHIHIYACHGSTTTKHPSAKVQDT